MSKRILAFFSVSILVLSVLPLKLTTQADATSPNTPPAADNIVYHGLTRLYTNFYNGVNGVVYDISKANAFNPTIRAGYYATFDVTVSDVAYTAIYKFLQRSKRRSVRYIEGKRL